MYSESAIERSNIEMILSQVLPIIYNFSLDYKAKSQTSYQIYECISDKCLGLRWEQELIKVFDYYFLLSSLETIK